MSPVAIVRQCNSVGLSLVVWVVSGVVSVMKAMCFIELGMLFPRAGGEWAYIREINGETLAFLKLVSMYTCLYYGVYTSDVNNTLFCE